MKEMSSANVEKETASGDEPVPIRLRPLEEKEAAIAEFEKFCAENIGSDSGIMDAYLEERAALSKIYPNTLVDLGRAGIIKMRVFREDGSSYFLPEDEEADS